MILTVSRSLTGEDQEAVILPPFLSGLSNNSKAGFKSAVTFYLVQSFFDGFTYKIEGYQSLTLSKGRVIGNQSENLHLYKQEQKNAGNDLRNKSTLDTGYCHASLCDIVNKEHMSRINDPEKVKKNESSLVAVSFVLSVLAAYKAYLGTRNFSQNYLFDNEALIQIAAVTAASPAVSFYYKSVIIKLTDLRMCRGRLSPGLVLDAFLGVCYGASSFGMLELADSSNELLFLRLAVGVVNTFLGTHKAAVISRMICSVPSKKQSHVWASRLSSMRQMLVTAILKIEPRTKMQEFNDAKSLPILEQLVILQKKFDSALEKKVQSSSGGRVDTRLLLPDVQLHSLINAYYTTQDYDFSYPVCGVDLLYPFLVVYSCLAILLSLAVASAAIVSNVKGLSYSADKMGLLSEFPAIRYSLSVLFNVAVLGLNLKDTKKYVELSLTRCIHSEVAVSNAGYSFMSRARANFLPSFRDAASFFWSATQAPAGVYYTLLSIQEFNLPYAALGFILMSNAFLVTSTKAKTVNYWLGVLSEKLCRSEIIDSATSFNLKASILDASIFGLMKSYVEMLEERFDMPAKRRQHLQHLNESLGKQSGQNHTIEVRKKIQQTLIKHCAALSSFDSNDLEEELPIDLVRTVI